MDDAGKAVLVVVLIVVFLAAIAGTGGRSRGGRTKQPSGKAPPTATREERPAPPVEAKPTPEEQVKHVKEAEETAAKLGQAIDTLDDVCREAVDTQRALLTANLGKKPDTDVPEEAKKP